MAEYLPKGEMVTVGEKLPVYVARPAGSCNRAVIMFSDMFGVYTGRHRQFCDQLAEDGYFTVCPDFFFEAPYMPNAPQFGVSCSCAFKFLFGILCGGFRKNTRNFHMWDPKLKALVMDVLVPWMQAQGAQSFASVGFCWGSYGVAKTCMHPELFKCGMSFHPSTEGYCKDTGEDHIQLCRDVKVPQLCVSTAMESEAWRPNGAAHKACQEALPGKEVKFELEAKQQHGFMTRSLTTEPESLAAVKRGWDMMLTFLHNHHG